MKALNTQKVALVFAVFLGGWHLLWSILILVGLAQPLLDFVFWMHMIANPYHVLPFSMMQATILVVATFGIGYIGGWTFALLWNWLHK